MINEKGFTLIETVVVLSIVSLLIVIGSSVPFRALEEYRTNHFFTIFQDDILYMQKRTIVKQESLYMTIDPENNSYVIKTGGFGKKVRSRELPKDWIIRLNTLKMPLSFTTNGSVRYPGMFSIQTSEKRYSIYFPHGKARSYIVEK